MKTAIKKIKVMERIRKEITRIDELAADIKRNGLLNAVTVMPLDGGEFRLLAGLRRIKAVQSLGWAEVEVNVVSPADAESALRIEISENEQREPFTYSEKMDFARLIEEIETAKARERMLAGKSISHSDPVTHGPQGSSKSRSAIGAKIGMSGRQYDRAKYIVENASPEIIEQLDKGECTIRGAYEALRANEKEAGPPSAGSPKSAAPQKVQPERPTPKISTTASAAKTPQHRPTLSSQDEEAIHKLREYHALPPEGKIEELQRQLREERARAAGAESELARLKELHHNDVYHKDSIIDSLNRQLDTANARIRELEAKYESV